uniref:Uncharacterized protein n=1 Tax=Arion vulgaris TaxID=1028688 RepID=A0A0B6YSY1_9EUPU
MYSKVKKPAKCGVTVKASDRKSSAKNNFPLRLDKTSTPTVELSISHIKLYIQHTTVRLGN